MNYRPVRELFVATPAMLRYLGMDPASIDPGTNFLVPAGVATNKLIGPSCADRRDVRITNAQRIAIGRHLFGSGRTVAFITTSALRRHGWKQIPGGWLVDADRTLTSDQIADTRQLASNAGLTIDVRWRTPTFAKTMAIATGAGGVLALGILAMTVGLIRSESASDLRTLTAAGATSRIRRTLTATTAGALALLGALLGVAGAYVTLAALYYDDLGYLRDLPVLFPPPPFSRSSVCR